MGAHVFVGGGLLRSALPYAERIGAGAVQVFVSNPRGWALSAGDPVSDEGFGAECAARGWPVYVHAPYLVNLASPDEMTRHRSVETLKHNLGRARRLGARGVVMHAGSTVRPVDRDAGLRRVREHLLPLADQLGRADADLLIEPTAGGGGALAARVEDVPALVAAVDAHPRVGICLDTCHLFAAGHDIGSAAGARRTIDTVIGALGAERVRLLHANDSAHPIGSGRDRHANIGAGTIGHAGFRALLRHPALRHVPVLIETGGDAALHARDIATLRSWQLS